jgi:predicted nucleotidyltransferase
MGPGRGLLAFHTDECHNDTGTGYAPTMNKQSHTQEETQRLQELSTVLRQHLPQLREQYKLKSLAVFGSYVRAEQRRRSDLDVLVDFEEAPTLLQLSALQRQLSDLVGVKVDLALKRTLKPAIGEVILSEAIYV